jgi:hypothetical protein
MRLKYIIITVFASAGILFGTYNWISYFKKQAPATMPAMQALRPTPSEELAQIEQPSAAGASSETQAQAVQKTENKSSSGPVFQFPDTVGRNPFLWPEEIQAIAEGETFDELLLEPITPAGRSFPDLKLTGLIQDNTTGNYRAMINGRIFEIGDMLGEERIVEITGRSVVLESSGKQRTLALEAGNQQRAGAATIKVKKNP